MTATLTAPKADLTVPAVDLWPPRQIVATMPGSLPMGGVVADTPIHAFHYAPSVLQWQTQPSLQPQRHDIELGGLLAFVIEEVVTAAEADSLIAASECFGYRDEAPGISTPPGMRMNKSVHWVAPDSMMFPMMARIQALLPQVIDDAPLHHRLSQRINMYRYDAEDVFNRHTDGDWPGYGLDPKGRQMEQWPGHLRSCLTMLLYLNGPAEGVHGGATRLYRRDGSWQDVIPKKGSALFFRHGFGLHSVLHEGRRVTSSDEGQAVSKYVARVNVLYDTVV